jgi:hypothetical protein
MRAEDCPNREGVDDSLCFNGAEIPDMPPKAIRTSRSLKNTDIGIDISVPGHEPASSPKVVKRYHVLVITSLPHFKEATQSEDSVVQFTVRPSG